VVQVGLCASQWCCPPASAVSNDDDARQSPCWASSWTPLTRSERSARVLVLKNTPSYFKIAVLVFRCLLSIHQCICQRLSAHLRRRKRRLRSTDTAMCVVRRSRNIFGDRCFATAGPPLWSVELVAF